jgi:hypothetical protein
MLIDWLSLSSTYNVNIVKLHNWFQELILFICVSGDIYHFICWIDDLTCLDVGLIIDFLKHCLWLIQCTLYMNVWYIIYWKHQIPFWKNEGSDCYQKSILSMIEGPTLQLNIHISNSISIMIAVYLSCMTIKNGSKEQHLKKICHQKIQSRQET